MTPLCKDCRHCCQSVRYYPTQFGIGMSVNYGLERCALTDAVYGTGEGGDFCHMERSEHGTCGPYGTRFESQPPPPPKPQLEPKTRRWWKWWRA